MSPLFGHKDDAPGEELSSSALATEIERLDALALGVLAAEVMTRGFGPGAPGADEDGTVTVGGPNINSGVTVGQIADEFLPEDARRNPDERLLLGLQRLVAEGVQALEHAALIRAQMHSSMGSLDYALTRFGRAALERSGVERVLAGEPL